MSQTGQKLSRTRIWWKAIRPQTLWASICPIMMSSVLAWGCGQFSVIVMILALLAVLGLQIGTNLTNDYYDCIRGTDNEERIGPLRVMQAGLVTEPSMRVAIILSFGLSLLIGAYFSLSLGWEIFFLTFLSVCAGFMYTGGMFPLGYHGLGDIFAFVFFGPMAVAGTYYLQTAEVSRLAILVGFAPGFFSVALITVNNLRDVAGDRSAGKKTLAVRFGPMFARVEYVVSLVLAVAIAIALAVLKDKHFYIVIPIVIPILALPSLRAVWNPQIDGPSLNQTLARTGKLLLLYTILFTLGWLF